MARESEGSFMQERVCSHQPPPAAPGYHSAPSLTLLERAQAKDAALIPTSCTTVKATSACPLRYFFLILEVTEVM